jgi:predicted alpha/beta-fold hydrolase
MLPGAHLPTIWGKKMRRRPPVHDRVERLTTPDGDHLTMARAGTPGATKRHLLVLHGLEGTITAKYAHGLLALALGRGWSADLLLFRSCDGQMNSARRLYHSGETTDLDFVVRHLHRTIPGVQLMICGVSLGGNVLVKWLGESGDAGLQLVHRAAAVSVPFDLGAGSRYLERGLSTLYTRHFLSTLVPKSLEKLAQFPGAFDRERAIRAKTFWEFDDAVTAPLHGFRDAADYYERSSSMSFISRVRVPTLLFGALDDPFVPPGVMDMAASEATRSRDVESHFTPRGGHVGWIEGTAWPSKYYMEARIMEYLSL